jgi:hypothetical protein
VGLGFAGRRKIRQPHGVVEKFSGFGFAGPGGPAFIPGSLFVSADLGQPIPKILLFVSANLGQLIPTIIRIG